MFKENFMHPDKSMWQRHSRSERLTRLLMIMVLAAVGYSAQNIEIIPEFLLDAPAQVKDLFVRMWPIQFGFYQKGFMRHSWIRFTSPLWERFSR